MESMTVLERLYAWRNRAIIAEKEVARLMDELEGGCEYPVEPAATRAYEAYMQSGLFGRWAHWDQLSEKYRGAWIAAVRAAFCQEPQS